MTYGATGSGSASLDVRQSMYHEPHPGLRWDVFIVGHISQDVNSSLIKNIHSPNQSLEVLFLQRRFLRDSDRGRPYKGHFPR